MCYIIIVVQIEISVIWEPPVSVLFLSLYFTGSSIHAYNVGGKR